jgi:hypothetical protein
VLPGATGADFGYYNMGGIRDTFRQGPVTARHIWQIEPFSNQLMVVTAKGSVIKYMLQNEASQAERVTSLEDERIYRVATSDFIAAQAQKALGDAVQVENQSMLMRDLLIDYIEVHGLEIDQGDF